MLSGIEPAEILIDQGIPIVVDNPNVGKNLYNHTIPTAVFSANPEDNPHLTTRMLFMQVYLSYQTHYLGQTCHTPFAVCPICGWRHTAFCICYKPT